MFVLVILLTTGTFVARAKVALWIVLGELGQLRRLCLALPWTLGAMGGDKNVLSGEWVDWKAIYQLRVLLKDRK